MENKKIIDEIIGWYGAIAIITAFALISFQFLNANDIAYQILNSTGAIGVIYISLKKKVYQPAVLNIIWAIIAIIAIINLLA